LGAEREKLAGQKGGGGYGKREVHKAFMVRTHGVIFSVQYPWHTEKHKFQSALNREPPAG